MEYLNSLFIFFLLLFIGCKESISNESIPLGESLYNEEYRPQFHFSPQEKWMNDPNGMVYKDGEYHLFYQYYPDSIVWGPMHWGHAVSKDLVYWDHLPIALYPDSMGYIFSGSAVVDENNTSGLGEDGQAPLVAIFTHHNPEMEEAGILDFQYQSIAYSNDNGRTWTKYKGNPVVENPGIKDFRDPKVIWNEDSESWIMVLAAYDKAIFYKSKNLIDWEKSGEFGITEDMRLWECPDLFTMKVESSNEEKWVLITSIQKDAPNGGTATSYFVGDFDGNTFVGNAGDQKWLDYGKDNYAFVTWSGIPSEDGRKVGIGWMSNWQYAQSVPTETWRSAMTMPRELKLVKEKGSYYLKNFPVIEIDKLLNLELQTDEIKVINDSLLFMNDGGLQHKLEFTIDKTQLGNFEIHFSNDNGEYLAVGHEASTNRFYIDRTHLNNQEFSKEFSDVHYGDIPYQQKSFNLEIYLDRSSVELFINEGLLVMTDLFYSKNPLTKISIHIKKDSVKISDTKIYSIDKIW